MTADHISALRAAVIAAGQRQGEFIEYLDDFDRQAVVTAVIERNGQMVATLADGAFVALSDEEVAACDFRRVAPAIPLECPGRDCAACPLQPVCPNWKPQAKTPSILAGLGE